MPLHVPDSSNRRGDLGQHDPQRGQRLETWLAGVQLRSRLPKPNQAQTHSRGPGDARNQPRPHFRRRIELRRGLSIGVPGVSIKSKH